MCNFSHSDPDPANACLQRSSRPQSSERRGRRNQGLGCSGHEVPACTTTEFFPPSTGRFTASGAQLALADQLSHEVVTSAHHHILERSMQKTKYSRQAQTSRIKPSKLSSLPCTLQRQSYAPGKCPSLRMLPRAAVHTGDDRLTAQALLHPPVSLLTLHN